MPHYDDGRNLPVIFNAIAKEALASGDQPILDLIEEANEYLLTDFEDEILSQALTDYAEGIGASDLEREDPDRYYAIMEAWGSLHRKLKITDGA